jgi:Plasmid pRiA4b ORF-3-like protein
VPAYLQFRIELHDVQPAIWRRFLIRPDATFAELHDAIQAACGWKNSHLYCFYPKAVGPKPLAGVPDEDYPGMPEAERVRLDTHFGSNRRCLYLYDFGDGWEHEVSLEETSELPAVFERKLIDGARAFPPEDCGGVSGYEDCAALIAKGKPTSPDERAYRKWLGRWEPERFELEKVARQFDRPRARKASGP